MELLALKLGPNEWFKQYNAERQKETTPVFAEAHFFPTSQLDLIKGMLATNEPYAQILSVEVSEPSIVWDVQVERAAPTTKGVSRMNLGDDRSIKKLRDEILKWAGRHSDKIDVWSFSQEHSVSYHSVLEECRGLVRDGYLYPVQDSLAVCGLTPTGDAAASALL